MNVSPSVCVAVIVLAVLGLVELVFRCLVALVSIPLTVGMILMVDGDFAEGFLKPTLLGLVASLVRGTK